MSSNRYYQERMQLAPGARELSSAAYNAVIGGVLLYGFIADAVIVKLFTGRAVALLSSGSSSYYRTLIGLLIGYVICCIVGSVLVHRSDNAVLSFVGFNLFAIPIGFLLAVGTLPFYSSSVVARAFVLTAIITAVMLVVSTILPDTFLSMGKALFISLLVCIVVDVVALIMGQHLVIVDYAVTFIFTLFVGYDWARANACAKTLDNAIDCAAELYLDIINLFIRILSILGDHN